MTLDREDKEAAYRTPLQSVSHQEWLEKKIIKKAYELCYTVLTYQETLEEYYQDHSDTPRAIDEYGMMEAYANEILLIRDLMNEGD